MIDVDFEHSVRVLERTWRDFLASSRDEGDYHKLCRAFRAAKLCFFDIDRWYGTAYDASALEALANEVDGAVAPRSRSRYLSSIRRHVREILRRFHQRANPSRRRVPIYASSVA